MPTANLPIYWNDEEMIIFLQNKEEIVNAAKETARKIMEREKDANKRRVETNTGTDQ